jgi:hypothetical protein
MTPIDRALRRLVPNGSRKAILALFDNRVTWSAIRHWRKGRALPPQWAVNCLRDYVAPVLAIEARTAEHGGALMAWLRSHGRLPPKEKAPD